MALRTIVRVGIVAALGAVMSVGAGCSGSKDDELALAQQEAVELRERNAALEQDNRNQSSQLADLQAQMAALRAAQTQPPATGPGGWGGGSGGGGGSRSDNFGTDDRGRMVAEVAGDVLFASGQATLKPESRRKLDSIARELNGRFRGSDILIEGHTDSDPIRKSRWGTNERLSKARADAVRDYLASKGVSEGRMITEGKGSTEPKGTKAASRRVEIVILGS